MKLKLVKKDNSPLNSFILYVNNKPRLSWGRNDSSCISVLNNEKPIESLLQFIPKHIIDSWK